MNLLDLTKQLHQLDPELTIYAKSPWSVDSEAALSVEPENSLVPESLRAQGFTYFLEVCLATDVVPDLSAESRGGELQSWCERLIQYAETDA